ncbi:ATP-binding protein [Streptomyces sp. NPDC087422]|uniref:ATP-binding protein n=1 Tax=Streptomyces sp. NPDC087422 TaxID=3365786 RepID=UPI0038121848
MSNYEQLPETLLILERRSPMPTKTVAPRGRPRMIARHRIALGLRPELAEVGRARHELRDRLAEWRLSEAADVALIVLSELVGNALQHAPCPSIALTVTAADGHVLIEVRDSSRRPPVIDRGPDRYGETGRGLPLVAALSRDWGWTPHENGTKTTWAVVAALVREPA